MRARITLLVAVLLTSLPASLSHHTFGIQAHRFVLDGRPFQIISGEMHYARIPREYWRDRLKKARAMGLNTISTYVFWNLHEPRPGEYDFRGQLDVAEFIRTAQKEGLHVILRSGPYVCAEWDLGGLPAWLLADPDIVLRSSDPKFLKPAARWLKRLGQELAPLQVTRGGPIIAVQVENEYGSFDREQPYMRAIHKALLDAGLGEALLYTADGPSQLPNGTLPDLPAVVNFGPGEAKEAFAALAKFRPGQPLMSGEYWAGWFDHWGKPHHTTDAAVEERELAWMLEQGYSVNLYMFHGGTTPGFMNGANYDRSGFLPQTSSYDYDSALDEAGRPTKKYFAFREVIEKHLDTKLPQPPSDSPFISIPRIDLKQSSALWYDLPSPIAAETPRPMESLGQSYGYVLYRTKIDAPLQGALRIADLHDYAVLFIDGTKVGALDRRLNQDTLPLDITAPATLDILVENNGRINFSKRLREDRKGITHSVTVDGHELRDWQIFPLPMSNLRNIRWSDSAVTGPAFYHAVFRLDRTGDTFLDLRHLRKGVVWLNGHLLGRFWNLGPQQTLYIPGPWLKKGENTLLVFDLEAGPQPFVEGLTAPILNELRERTR